MNNEIASLNICNYTIQLSVLSTGTCLNSLPSAQLRSDSNTQQKDALSQVGVLPLKLSTSDDAPDRTKCPGQHAHLHVAIQYIFAFTIHRVFHPHQNLIAPI